MQSPNLYLSALFVWYVPIRSAVTVLTTATSRMRNLPINFRVRPITNILEGPQMNLNTDGETYVDLLG
jgi:hypothetical protein